MLWGLHTRPQVTQAANPWVTYEAKIAMGRRENKAMPRVESGYLYSETASFVVDSPAWQAWLVCHIAFYFSSRDGSFTARKELRNGGYYWYGYRRQDGKTHKVYLGKSSDITVQRLADVARQLAERIEGDL